MQMWVYTFIRWSECAAQRLQLLTADAGSCTSCMQLSRTSSMVLPPSRMPTHTTMPRPLVSGRGMAAFVRSR